MKPTTFAWIFYLSAAVLTLVWKWAKWCHTGKKLKKPVLLSTHEWFDIGLFEDKISWITTIFVVWLFGALYIDKVTWLFPEYFSAIPIHPAIAGLFGSIMEFAAPAATKFVINKIPFPKDE